MTLLAPVMPGAEPVSVVAAVPGAPGVVCLHGFGGSPGSVRPLVDAFIAGGWSVEAPLLPGHGTTVADLAATGWDDWLSAARMALTAAGARGGRGASGQVVVVGQSMGGSLALELAASGAPLAGLVCINAPIRPQDDDLIEMAREMVAVGEVSVPAGRPDLADPAASDVAYDEVALPAWLSLMRGLAGLAGLGAPIGRLSQVRVPVLVVTSAQDHVVDPGDGDVIARSVSGAVERLVLSRSAHVAALDLDRDLLCDRAVALARTWVEQSPR